MDKEQELRPCPFCGGEAVLDEFENDHIIGWFGRCLECNASMPYAISKPIAVKQWNRRSSDEQAEVVERRDVLFFASYCGGDNPACTPARPCANCIAMGNVYSIPVGTQVLFQREFGASPPAVAAGGVTEEQVEAAARSLAADHYAHRFQKTGDDPHVVMNVDANWQTFSRDAKIAITAALAVRDEGIREGWQDISTVPKDGREVVLRVRSRAGVPGGTVVGHYMQGGHCIEDHPPIAAGWYFWGGTSFDLASEPTHWQPLPIPPSRGEGI